MSTVTAVQFCPSCNLALYEYGYPHLICINMSCERYQTPDAYSILAKLERFPGKDPAYVDKMMHDVPPATVVDRIPYILDKCKGKRVLNLGCASGDMHGRIKAVASSVIGVDQEQPCDWICNLDETPNLATTQTFDLIVAGEILEHLSNPGNLLRELRKLDCALLITVPNAFYEGTHYWMKRGIENVNPQHVSWYSYWTLKTLVERYQFTITDWHYYNGQMWLAEGLIMTAR